MSNGGLMQIVAVGLQNKYLSGDPEITFFKAMYRRHTNFATESIAQVFNGDDGPNGRLSTTVARNGDLVGRLWLEVSVPAASTARAATQTVYDFVESVSVEIGGTLVDRHTGEWLQTWHELTRAGPQHTALHDMSEIPANKDAAIARVPLEFWFCKEAGQALPLIALQYHEVKVLVDRSAVALPAGARLQLFVDYTFLDTEERRRFAQANHEYLIEQVQTTGYESLTSGGRVRLDFNHPVKELLWVTRDGTGARVAGVEKARLQLNGHDRFAERDGAYFSTVQRLQHHEGTLVSRAAPVEVAEPKTYNWTEISTAFAPTIQLTHAEQGTEFEPDSEWVVSDFDDELEDILEPNLPHTIVNVEKATKTGLGIVLKDVLKVKSDKTIDTLKKSTYTVTLMRSSRVHDLFAPGKWKTLQNGFKWEQPFFSSAGKVQRNSGYVSLNPGNTKYERFDQVKIETPATGNTRFIVPHAKLPGHDKDGKALDTFQKVKDYFEERNVDIFSLPRNHHLHLSITTVAVTTGSWGSKDSMITFTLNRRLHMAEGSTRLEYTAKVGDSDKKVVFTITDASKRAAFKEILKEGTKLRIVLRSVTGKSSEDPTVYPHYDSKVLEVGGQTLTIEKDAEESGSTLTVTFKESLIDAYYSSGHTFGFELVNGSESVPFNDESAIIETELSDLVLTPYSYNTTLKDIIGISSNTHKFTAVERSSNKSRAFKLKNKDGAAMTKDSDVMELAKLFPGSIIFHTLSNGNDLEWTVVAVDADGTVRLDKLFDAPSADLATDYFKLGSTLSLDPVFLNAVQVFAKFKPSSGGEAKIESGKTGAYEDATVTKDNIVKAIKDAGLPAAKGNGKLSIITTSSDAVDDRLYAMCVLASGQGSYGVSFEQFPDSSTMESVSMHLFLSDPTNPSVSIQLVVTANEDDETFFAHEEYLDLVTYEPIDPDPAQPLVQTTPLAIKQGSYGVRLKDGFLESFATIDNGSGGTIEKIFAKVRYGSSHKSPKLRIGFRGVDIRAKFGSIRLAHMPVPRSLALVPMTGTYTKRVTRGSHATMSDSDKQALDKYAHSYTSAHPVEMLAGWKITTPGNKDKYFPPDTVVASTNNNQYQLPGDKIVSMSEVANGAVTIHPSNYAKFDSLQPVEFEISKTLNQTTVLKLGNDALAAVQNIGEVGAKFTGNAQILLIPNKNGDDCQALFKNQNKKRIIGDYYEWVFIPTGTVSDSNRAYKGEFVQLMNQVVGEKKVALGDDYYVAYVRPRAYAKTSPSDEKYTWEPMEQTTVAGKGAVFVTHLTNNSRSFTFRLLAAYGGDGDAHSYFGFTAVARTNLTVDEGDRSHRVGAFLGKSYLPKGISLSGKYLPPSANAVNIDQSGETIFFASPQSICRGTFDYYQITPGHMKHTSATGVQTAMTSEEETALLTYEASTRCSMYFKRTSNASAKTLRWAGMDETGQYVYDWKGAQLTANTPIVGSRLEWNYPAYYKKASDESHASSTLLVTTGSDSDKRDLTGSRYAIVESYDYKTRTITLDKEYFFPIADNAIHANDPYKKHGQAFTVTLPFPGDDDYITAYRPKLQPFDYTSPAATTAFGKERVLSAELPTYVYSFALDPEKLQPSGTCNFSRIDSAELRIDPTADAQSASIYAVNYNVLRIKNGMGGLAYSN